MFAEFINACGKEILGILLTFIFGYLGIVAKNLAAKFLNDKTKQSIAKTVVLFVEQVYKDLHGDEKLNAALAAASELLGEKGIFFSEFEMKTLIEAAVAEFNGAFYDTGLLAEELGDTEGSTDYTTEEKLE